MPFRYAQRRDANETLIEHAVAKCGAQWVQAPPLDGWVGWQGRWIPVEIKRPPGPRGGLSGRHYTPTQVDFMRLCAEKHLPVYTWFSIDDVVACLT
jgi:hypothetical protein